MKLSNIFFPPPFTARHIKRTFVSSPEDEVSHANRELVECASAVALKTLDVDVSDLSERIKGDQKWTDQWPGEHYRLLAGFVAWLKPRLVIEVGTETGLSALCLKKYLPSDGRLVTFDLVPWDKIQNTCLRKDDFADGRLEQKLVNLGDQRVFGDYADLLKSADLFFVDGPKDRVFEAAFAMHLNTLDFVKPPWVIFDDIRDMNMLKFWREMDMPKLDISSFGHWTGTGLVRWHGRA